MKPEPDREPFHINLFRRLKPLYGKKIDALWIEYELADIEGKRRIAELLTILAVKRLNIAIGDEKIVLEPPAPNIIGNGEYTIGTISYPGIPPYPFTLHRQELLRHIFLLGPSGTGKSTLIIGLLRQFLRDNLPFWCIDFKRNYRCLLHDKNGDKVLVLTVGRETAPVALNMLQPPPGVQTDEAIETLSDVISASYLLMHGARNVLKSALLAAIANKGSSATLRDAKELTATELAKARGGSRRYGWLESTYRTLEELTKLGDALSARNPIPFAELLGRPVVFELQALGEDQKKAFCLYLLQSVLLLRKHQTDERETLRHICVFDEAHNSFQRDEWNKLSVPSRLAREVREYGEGIIAATQQADVADSLIANSSTKIILRTDYPKDVEFASKLLQIDNRWLAKIPLGQGIARLATRYYQPFLFSFPEQPLKNQQVTDEQVRERYAQWRGTTPEEATTPPSQQPATPAELSERERTLLADIAAHPISTITQRYERLGWNPKTGNTIKDRLFQSSLIAFEVIPIPGSRVKLLTLTEKGITHAHEHGMSVPSRGRAGLEHEFWRARIKERCETRGYTVTAEQVVPMGGRVDLHATNGRRSIYIEIETGKSDVAANIKKCQGLNGTVVFFFTDEALRNRFRQPLDGILVLTPSDLNRLSEILLHESGRSKD